MLYYVEVYLSKALQDIYSFVKSGKNFSKVVPLKYRREVSF